jgi:hypothetical protein
MALVVQEAREGVLASKYHGKEEWSRRCRPRGSEMESKGQSDQQASWLTNYSQISFPPIKHPTILGEKK